MNVPARTRYLTLLKPIVYQQPSLSSASRCTLIKQGGVHPHGHPTKPDGRLDQEPSHLLPGSSCSDAG